MKSRQASSMSFRQIRTAETELYFFFMKKEMIKGCLKKSMGPLKDRQKKCQETRHGKSDP